MPVPNQYKSNRIEMKLEKADSDFINYCIDEITEAGMLPFTIPPASLPRIIRDAALWFYRECEEATEERWFVIKKEDLKFDNHNKSIILPDAIEAVIDVKQVNDAYRFKQLAVFMTNPIMYSASQNMLGGGGIQGSINNPYRMADARAGFEETVTRMYEANLMKTLFSKGIRFDYNPFSHTINFLGEVITDIVLATLVRVPLHALYNDIRFRQYVVAKACMKLKRILNTFDFQYPGEVKINFDELESMGKEVIEKIEEQISSESSAADIILMK